MMYVRDVVPGHRFKRFCVTAISALAAASGIGAHAADAGLPRQIAVKLLSGNSLPAILSTYSLTLEKRLGPRPMFLLRTIGNADLNAKVVALRADPRVAFAEPNFRLRDPEARRRSVWAIGSASNYQAQWAPAQLGLEQAHAATTGTGIKVAVIDTGVDYAHPALADRLLPGIDFVDNDNDPSEQGDTSNLAFGHGTHVAGIVALAAPGATILPLRVLDPQGRGNIWAVAEALIYAADPDRNPTTPDQAHVINLSLGTTSPTKLLDKVVELVTCSNDDDNEADEDDSDPGFAADRERCSVQHGSVVVAAAGNGGSSGEVQYPAGEAAGGALSVGANTKGSRIAGFSNRGSWVQITAPGVGITSAVPGGGYGVWSGTSMAAPLVAGIAALAKARNPDWKPVDVTKRLTDRSVLLCGTTLRRVDARGAVFDAAPAVPTCP